MIKHVLGLALTAFIATSAAQAATLDFVAEAAGNERGLQNGSTLTFDGLTVEFQSSHFAYLDDRSGGKPGGLGVCKVLTSSAQCNPGNDDNLTFGESVTLIFDRMVSISGLSFGDANHNSLNASNKMLRIDTGAGLTPISFMQAVSATFEKVNQITFAYGSSNPSQFYVQNLTATPVPLPAGIVLLGGALGALGFARRRRAAA